VDLFLSKIRIDKENLSDWLLIDDGIVLDYGTGDDYEEHLSDGINIHDYRDRYIIPGLYDAHVHLVQSGLANMGVELSQCQSIDEVLEIIQREVEKEPDVIMGFGFDETKFKEKRVIERKDLDSVSENIPIWISRRDAHMGVINSASFKKFSSILKGDLREQINRGIVVADTSYKIRQAIFEAIPYKDKITATLDICKLALSRGITSVHALEGGRLFGAEDPNVILDIMDKTPLNITLYPQTTDLDMVRELGVDRVGGCLLVDGSIGSYTAGLFEDYSDRSGERGELYFEYDELEEFVKKANREGLQVALHAIGDRAIEMALDVYESALRDYSRDDARHRIEHFELATDEQIERARELGVCVCMQPTFERFWGGKGGMYEERLGDRPTNRLRTVMTAGVGLGFGSDSDVTPMDSLLGLASAMLHPNEGERLRFVEALYGYTEGASYLGFEEDERGSLRKGQIADMVILSESPEDMSGEELLGVEVVGVVVGGKSLKEV
jgi:hypothetical protein